MKKRMLTSLFVIFACCSYAQIPNQSFEDWNTVGGYEIPNLWGTMNNTTASSAVYTATKGTPGKVGSAYLKLTSKTVGSSVVNGIAVSGVLDSITQMPVSGFAFSQRPQSFTGKWQHMLSGSSAGSVSVLLTRWNISLGVRETVATATQGLSGMVMSWGNFSINFTYQSSEIPDTCIIVLKASGASPTNGDYLYVDNLAFTGSVTDISELPEQVLVTSPNPANNEIVISGSKAFQRGDRLTITDMFGKVVFDNFTNGNTVTVGTATFPNGTYVYKLHSNDGNQNSNGKFVVIH